MVAATPAHLGTLSWWGSHLLQPLPSRGIHPRMPKYILVEFDDRPDDIAIVEVNPETCEPLDVILELSREQARELAEEILEYA